MKSTTSSCDKAGKEEENEEETSPAVASAVGSSNSEADFSSNSDQECNPVHEIANGLHMHVTESIQECSDTGHSSCRVSTTAEKSYFNLDDFTKYFPELELSQDSPCSSPFCDPDKGPIEKPRPPVVVVPTAVLTTSSETNTESGRSNFLIKSAVHFVEEPFPQVLGHIPPTKPEPVYHKSLSVDRLVWIHVCACGYFSLLHAGGSTSVILHELQSPGQSSIKLCLISIR